MCIRLRPWALRTTSSANSKTIRCMVITSLGRPRTPLLLQPLAARAAGLTNSLLQLVVEMYSDYQGRILATPHFTKQVVHISQSFSRPRDPISQYITEQTLLWEALGPHRVCLSIIEVTQTVEDNLRHQDFHYILRL